MVYDRGEGDEEEVLKEEPLRIDLKKVEIKNIKETSLMSVDADGNETDTSLLTEKPAECCSTLPTSYNSRQQSYKTGC